MERDTAPPLPDRARRVHAGEGSVRLCVCACAVRVEGEAGTHSEACNAPRGRKEKPKPPLFPSLCLASPFRCLISPKHSIISPPTPPTNPAVCTPPSMYMPFRSCPRHTCESLSAFPPLRAVSALGGLVRKRRRKNAWAHRGTAFKFYAPFWPSPTKKAGTCLVEPGQCTCT